MEEKWLPIVGYEGKYEVSDLGQVKSFVRCKDGKIMSPSKDKDGYLSIKLSKDKVVNYRVHRLILQTFQPTEEDLVCDHINHIKNDNRLVNLRWATISQNSRYVKKREGLTSQYRGVSWYKKCNKWYSCCRLNGKRFWIGLFDDEREAGLAYNNFVISKELQDFVILNEIN